MKKIAIKSGVRAGGIKLNHNTTKKLKTGVRAGAAVDYFLK